MLYDKPLAFWSLKKCYCASPSFWPWLKLWWFLLRSLECLINDSFQFPPCLVSVCSWTELASNTPSKLLLLAGRNIFSPSTHTSSSTQPLISFSFLTLSAAIFSHVCCLPFCVLFFSLLHLHMPQVHMYIPPPSCKTLHVMPSLIDVAPPPMWRGFFCLRFFQPALLLLWFKPF